ncbi:regulatory protein SipA [Okeania sp.]|uniref:regulatory protein SipA n=1 Tax=Okeania sp. TaxID=3100323 RepID=UPI002B4AD359|nr:DUF3148 domain-containing protein [Okeania sp.]MEB3339805.1 DUF3148 domain-containing protein [Okeania sp.]
MENDFFIGQKVRLVVQPPYIKTAESMPILRPPNVVRLGELGTILSCKSENYWTVRFKKGAFLIDSQYIEAVAVDSETAQLNHSNEDRDKITPSLE